MSTDEVVGTNEFTQNSRVTTAVVAPTPTPFRPEGTSLATVDIPPSLPSVLDEGA